MHNSCKPTLPLVPPHTSGQSSEEKESERWLLTQQAIQASFELKQGVLTIVG